MTTAEATRGTGATELGQYRPALPDHGPGRWLRLIAGVKEDVLDWVPEERARYSRLGGIVLNTGILAGLSLLTALTNVVDAPWPVLLPVVFLWAMVIITFDGWLIASTHGIKASRLRLFVPRLLISILIGAVIAEPLLLWVFRPAIEKEVRNTRIAAVANYESTLTTCNPPSGEPLRTPACADARLNLQSPAALGVKQRELTSQRDRTQWRVDAINKVLRDKEATARAECVGRSGPGLTGISGEGPNCRQDRAEIDQYRRDSRLATYQADLLRLDRQLTQLTAQRADLLRRYAGEVSREIKKKVDDFRNNQQQIGILEEGAALSGLASRSNFVLVAEWLVRLLLVTVDCLPVLTKLMSRTTTYDALVSRQLETSKRLHEKEVDVREREETVAADIALYRMERDLRAGREHVDQADRAARARHEADLDVEVEKLAAQLRGTERP